VIASAPSLAILARPVPQRIPIRWRIFGFLFAVGLLEYLQQRGLTVAAERIMPSLRLSQMQIGWLEQAFVIGYALFQLPGGILGQVWGARRTVFAIGLISVLGISGTVAAPELLAGSSLFAVLLALQFVLGMGQAPTFPVSTGAFETWFPPAQWALVQGLQTMGLGLGAAIAPPLVAAVMTSVGWQWALLWTAVPAVPLFLLWVWYARDAPAEHPAVSVAELSLLQTASTEAPNSRISLSEIGSILRDRHVLLLTFAYFSMNYVFYLLGNWCFLYLVQDRHFSVLESGWLATMPPIAAGLGAGVGGMIASALFVRFGTRRGLRVIPLTVLPAAALLLLALPYTTNAYGAVAILALCYGLIELTEGSFWATAMTVGSRNTMAVGGIMNTGGSLGGVVGIPIVALLSGHGSWNMAFLVGAGFALASAAAWVLLDPAHRAASRTLPNCEPRSSA
jgi:MFS transporter, ACS family, glucarate transporter